MGSFSKPTVALVVVSAIGFFMAFGFDSFQTSRIGITIFVAAGFGAILFAIRDMQTDEEATAEDKR